MANKKGNWYNNIWLVTSVCAVGGTTLGTLIYDKVKDKPILTTLIVWLEWTWSIVVSIFAFKIAV